MVSPMNTDLPHARHPELSLRQVCDKGLLTCDCFGLPITIIAAETCFNKGVEMLILQFQIKVFGLFSRKR